MFLCLKFSDFKFKCALTIMKYSIVKACCQRVAIIYISEYKKCYTLHNMDYITLL